MVKKFTLIYNCLIRTILRGNLGKLSKSIDCLYFKKIANQIRRDILKMMLGSGSSHIGAALSIVEILVSLYFHVMKVDPSNVDDPQRDKFLLSKAHGSPALYSILAEKKFFPMEYLQTFYRNNGILPGHLDRESAPGIEYSLGSLGHGLPVGLGMAIANKQMNNSGKIFVLLGDGECNEGSVWESIMLASHLKLVNLTAIVDFNKIQSFGRTHEVINQKALTARWESFGWETHEINGHDFDQLISAFKSVQKGPKVIIANTVKGKGISFMEDKLEWHYKCPNEEEYEQALKELDGVK